MLWSDKYAPKKLHDVLGHASVINEVESWIKNWKPGDKPLLLHGPTGVGKTTIANALAKEYDLDLLETNASDVRNKAAIEKFTGLASQSKTLYGQTRLLLFDEVDGLNTRDRGGASAMVAVIKEAQCPIIMTANNIWDMKMAGLRNACVPVQVKKVHYATITKAMGVICDQEGIEYDRDALLEIAKNVSGDVRAAINDLQALADGKKVITLKDVQIRGQKDRKDNIFNAITIVLKSRTPEKSKAAFESVSEDPDMFLKWIDENLPKEYKKPEDLKAGMDAVSRADIYLGRVRKRQDYSMWKYAIVMMTQGVSLAKKETYSGWGRYGFPSLIKFLSASKGTRGQRKATAAKIAAHTHVSANVAIQDYLPMYTELIQVPELAPRITAQFDFDADDLKFLGLSTRKKTLDKAAKIKEEAIIASYKKEKIEKIKADKNQIDLSNFV